MKSCKCKLLLASRILTICEATRKFLCLDWTDQVMEAMEFLFSWTTTTIHYKKELRPTALRREKREEHLDTEGRGRRKGGKGEEEAGKERRKHRKEEQGERKNQPGQGDPAQVQREEEKAATEGEVLREDA
jgi:hypothetical protein